MVLERSGRACLCSSTISARSTSPPCSRASTRRAAGARARRRRRLRRGDAVADRRQARDPLSGVRRTSRRDGRSLAPRRAGRALHDVGHHQRPEARGAFATDDRLSQPPGGERVRVRRARRAPARGAAFLRRLRIQQHPRRVHRRSAGRADGHLRGRRRGGSRPAAPRHARLRQRRDVSPDARARSGARSVSERPVVRICRVQSRRRGLRPRGLGQARSARRPLRLERGAGPLLGAGAVGAVPAADRGRRAARGGKRRGDPRPRRRHRRTPPAGPERRDRDPGTEQLRRVLEQSRRDRRRGRAGRLPPHRRHRASRARTVRSGTRRGAATRSASAGILSVPRRSRKR